MAYSTKYILGSSNELNGFYEVYLDYLNYVGQSSVIIGAVDGLVIRCTTGDDNKFSPILGTECLMNILVGSANANGVVINDQQLTIFDLIASQDNQIRATVYANQDYTKSIFQGFVVVEDNSQPYLDPPFTLSIRALDGLGLLSNVDMVDTTGLLYAGVLSIEDWIGNILYKTGQTLNLRVYFPFYPAGASESMAPLQQVFLNAQTWQTGPITTTTDPSVDVFASEAVDALTALTQICTCLCARIFQEDGVWNFVCLYAYADQGGMFYNESTGSLAAGIYHMNTVAKGNGLNYDVPVGNGEIIHPVKDDAVIYLKLATKWVKLNYTYNQSANKICNQNFTLGNPNPTFDGTISSAIEDATILPVVIFQTKGYDAFCWTLAAGTFIGGGTFPFPETPSTVSIFVRAVLDNFHFEQTRYIVIPDASTVNHARSSSFLIDQNDNLQVSFDFRTRISLNVVTQVDPAIICLTGDDGSFWALGAINLSLGYQWYKTDSNFKGISPSPIGLVPVVFHNYTNGSGDTTADWVNYSVSVDINNQPLKTPVNGSVFIVLEGLPNTSIESWWKNIQVTIVPYMSGSFVQLKGDYNYSSSNNNIKQTVTNDVQISDSPKRYFQGALVQANNDLIPPTWHRRGVVESFRFTQLMERIIFNNLVNINQKIEGTLRGITWTDTTFNIRQAGFLNRYYFTDHPVPTKKFILTSFEKDYTTGFGQHLFVEILIDQNDTGFLDPNDPAVGKYVFQYLYNTQ